MHRIIKELKRIFSLSQKVKLLYKVRSISILLQYKLSYLSLRKVINLAIHLTAFKMDIYKYFSCPGQEYLGF